MVLAVFSAIVIIMIIVQIGVIIYVTAYRSKFMDRLGQAWGRLGAAQKIDSIPVPFLIFTFC
jgi:hypothetical protein